MSILLTVCNNISMKNVIKCVKSVKLLNLKLLNHLNNINNRLNYDHFILT